MSSTIANLSVSLRYLWHVTIVDVESTALVERMLNELIKATEAYQMAKNESAVHSNEANLNT